MTRGRGRSDEMLTVSEVIEEIGVSRATFYRWRAIGRAPRSLRLPNGEIRIWRSALDQWLRSLEESCA